MLFSSSITSNRGRRYLAFAGSVEHQNAVMFGYEELDRTRAWVESELREVRNRMQRQVNREIIEWREGRPHFSNIGEWVAK
jgi:hypothetical protein